MRNFAKILNMRYIIGFTFILFAIACKQHTAKPYNAREAAVASGENILKPQPITPVGSPFMTSYLALTEALVIAKDSAAVIAYTTFKNQTNNFTAQANKIDAAKLNEIAPYLAIIKGITADTLAQNIASLRIKLKALNSAMLPIAKACNGFGQKVYNQYCPMAFNNKGGNWLSYNPQIRNPYFGNSMLDCGYAQDSITVK